jgi:fatty-acyl-CoA synthase
MERAPAVAAPSDPRAAEDARALARSRRLVLPELVTRSARRRPDTPALIFEGRALTFGELQDRVRRLAAALAARGVAHGDRVAILMVNRPEFVETFLACQTIGACAVPVNFRLTAAEVCYVLDNAGARTLVCDGELLTTAGAVSRGVSQRIAVGSGTPAFVAVGSEPPAAAAVAPGFEDYEAVIAGGDGPPPAADPDDEDLAFLMYTSGTTGRPKGAMLSHQNLFCNTLNWIQELRATAADVWLSGLPLFHIGGLNGILPFLSLGSTTVIEPSTGFNAGRSIDLLVTHAATMCFFVPTQWREICEHPDVERLRGGPLRTAMWGASGAPRETLELMSRRLPGIDIVSAFGQTEMSSNTTMLRGPDAIRKLGSVGRPMVNVEVRVVDEHGADVTTGEVGEIVYRGPTVMQGYFDAPQATADAFAGGWFHSGDLVRQDDEGYLYVVDRKKDMIISGGENVYPAEVERVLLEHTAVAEAAVVGIDHPRWVETPLAVVVLRPGAGATAETLIAHCAQHLAGYKKPTAIRFVDALPRNAAGKVLKRELRRAYGSPACGASTRTV